MQTPRSWRYCAAILLLAASGCERSAVPVPAGGPPRIVVMAPSAAEMLGALGLADEVVGVGDFVSRPAELATRPRIGAFDSPNLESVLALHATHFVTTRGVAGAAALGRLRELGIEVVELETSTYDGTLASMRQLGGLLGRAAEAESLVAAIANEAAAVRARCAGAARRRVLFVVGQQPLFVAGPGSHIDALIAIAGGENVAAGAIGTYAQVSLEAMLERRPEVILDSSDNRPGAVRGRVLGAWAQWPFLPAVAERRVYGLDPAGLLVPGPRLGEMARLMAKLVHPEIFGEATDRELAGSDATPSAEGQHAAQ